MDVRSVCFPFVSAEVFLEEMEVAEVDAALDDADEELEEEDDDRLEEEVDRPGLALSG